MKNDKYFCNNCYRLFETPRIYEERHRLDSPPYEKVAVCPICGSDNFLKSETKMEKVEVVEKVLPAVMYFNRYSNAIIDVFGKHIKNSDYENGVALLMNLILEMFDFVDVGIQRKLFDMNSENDVNKMLMYLKGGI